MLPPPGLLSEFSHPDLNITYESHRDIHENLVVMEILFTSMITTEIRQVITNTNWNNFPVITGQHLHPSAIMIMLNELRDLYCLILLNRANNSHFKPLLYQLPGSNVHLRQPTRRYRWSYGSLDGCQCIHPHRLCTDASVCYPEALL